MLANSASTARSALPRCQGGRFGGRDNRRTGKIGQVTVDLR